MKTKNSILTQAFFLFLSMCCFSCINQNVENTNEQKTDSTLLINFVARVGTIQAFDGTIRDVYVYVIDSCEYVGYINAYRSDFLTHKGNCKYCAERAMHSLK